MVAENGWGLSARVRTGVIIAGLFTALPAHAADEAPPQSAAPSTPADDEVRRKLLLEHLPRRPTVGVLNVLTAVYGALFLTAGVAMALDSGRATPTQRSIFIATNGVLSASAFGTYLAPKPLRSPMLLSMAPLWFSGLALTFSCDPSNSPAENRVLGIAAGTGLAAATIPLLDALLEPPPDPWTFESDRNALQTADKTSLHGAVVRAEQHLARTIRPLRFVTPIVYLLGTIAMFIGAIDTPKSDQALKMTAVFATVYMSYGTIHLVAASAPSAAERYTRALNLVPVGPGGSAGLTAVWSF